VLFARDLRLVFAGVFRSVFTRISRYSDPRYSLMMQIGMICGFATGFPVNRWLIRAGLKKAMLQRPQLHSAWS
jgi:Domain of unknown function (DUF4396)